MPKNWLIYWGVIVIVGTAAIFAGAWLTQRIEFILPYTLAAGILMVAAGLFLETRKPGPSNEDDSSNGSSV